MNLGINKRSIIVLCPNKPENQNKKDPTFFLAVINVLNNKIFKSLYSVRNFLMNYRIRIPFKKNIINFYSIRKVSYSTPLLGSNKVKINRAQKIVNKRIMIGDWYSQC